MSNAVEVGTVEINGGLATEKSKTAKELKKEAAKAAKLAKFHEKMKKVEVKACQAKHLVGTRSMIVL